MAEEEVVVEETTDDSDYSSEQDSFAEEAEVAPEPEPVVEEPAPEEDVPPPSWFLDIMERRTKKQEQEAAVAAEEGEKPVLPPELARLAEQSILDEETLSALYNVFNKQNEATRAEALQSKNLADGIIRKQNERAIAKTMHTVHQKVYNDVFKNDPTLQGNKTAAAKADSIVHRWMDRAAWDAMEHGDTRALAYAESPEFGHVVAAMVKATEGLKDGSGSLNMKGAEVESARSVPANGDSSGFYSVYSKAEIEDARKVGISEADLRKAWEETGSQNFSDYDG